MRSPAILRFNCIPAPYSIYRDIHKLLPGTVLRYRNGEVTTQAFWSLRSSVERALVEPFTGSEEEAEEELDRLLRDAVKLRMHADVPLGAFLSGGIDSSLIVALMQAQSDRPVRTFSIGFHEEAYDEARDARAVARHLGTDHTELYVTSGEAIDLVSRLPDVYDEPFADSSQIPTLLVSQLTRRHVTVSLSGDGGDEVFGGYNRYTWGGRLWNGLERSPRLFAAASRSGNDRLRTAVMGRGIQADAPASSEELAPAYAGIQGAQARRSAGFRGPDGDVCEHGIALVRTRASGGGSRCASSLAHDRGPMAQAAGVRAASDVPGYDHIPAERHPGEA